MHKLKPALSNKHENHGTNMMHLKVGDVKTWERFVEASTSSCMVLETLSIAMLMASIMDWFWVVDSVNIWDGKKKDFAIQQQNDMKNGFTGYQLDQHESAIHKTPRCSRFLKSTLVYQKLFFYKIY